MIERLQVIATHLRRFRLLMALLALLSLTVLLLSLLESPWVSGADLIIPSILSFTWAATLFSFANVFAQVPIPPTAGAGWRARLGYRIHYMLFWILGLIMLALSTTLIVLTFKLVNIA